MNYYQFHIGDYSSHTSRLSPIEDLAYRRLLDIYYLTERPLNGCSTDVAREIGLQEYQTEVDYVLGKFFTQQDGFWVNSRCEKVIKTYKSQKEAASRAGKASGRARKSKPSEQSLNARSTDVQQEANEPSTNHKPITINQEPVKESRAKKFAPPTLKEVAEYCIDRGNDVDPMRFMDFYDSKGWMVGKNKMKDWKAAIRTWEQRNDGTSRQTGAERKLSVAERATEARKQWERDNPDT